MKTKDLIDLYNRKKAEWESKSRYCNELSRGFIDEDDAHDSCLLFARDRGRLPDVDDLLKLGLKSKEPRDVEEE